MIKNRKYILKKCIFSFDETADKKKKNFDTNIISELKYEEIGEK